MKKLVISAAAILAGAVAAPGAANAEVYTNLGYTQFSSDDVDVGGATARLGYKFTPNFGVEGEASWGLNEDTADVLGTPVDIKLNQEYGAYAVGFLPLGDKFELLGRVGYVNVDAASSFGGFNVGVDEDGVGFGGGLQWKVTDKAALRADYTRLEGNDDGVNAWGVSGAFSF